MKIQNSYSGFTLVETMTNIIIISTLTFAMMFVFYQIEQDFNIEKNRSEIINYSNRVLDEISNELSAAYQANKRKILNTTSLQLSYSNTADITRIWVNSNYGFFKNDTPMDSFLPKDEQNRVKYNFQKKHDLFNSKPFTFLVVNAKKHFMLWKNAKQEMLGLLGKVA